MKKTEKMTKGQIEAKISEVVSRFEVDVMGRGPEQIKTLLVRDLIVVRLVGFLSPAEKKLATTASGIELLKKMRMTLFEDNIEHLRQQIAQKTGLKVLSVHSDVSTKTGEKIIVFVTDQEMDFSI